MASKSISVQPKNRTLDQLLSVEKVIAQAKAQAAERRICYIKEGPVHYIVLNRKDNTFDSDWFIQFNAVLDQIESSSGAGILCTIGAGEKHFSTGFDLDFWCVKFENQQVSGDYFFRLMARLLQFPMPTLCICNGSTLAGGFLFAMCFDTRLMHEKRGNVELTELKLGIPLPLPMLLVCKAKLAPNVCIRLFMGNTFNSEKALRDGLIDGTYSSMLDLDNQIQIYCAKNASVGANRTAFKMVKYSHFGDLIDKCQSFVYSPAEFEFRYRNYLVLQKVVAKMNEQRRLQKLKKKKRPKL